MWPGVEKDPAMGRMVSCSTANHPPEQLTLTTLWRGDGLLASSYPCGNGNPQTTQTQSQQGKG